MRSDLRAALGRWLRDFGKLPKKKSCIAGLLEVTEAIVAGFAAPLEQSHRGLLLEVL